MNNVPEYIPPYYITYKRTAVGCRGALGTGDNARLSRPAGKTAPSGGNFGTAPAARASPRTADTRCAPVPDRHQVHATRVHQAGDPRGSSAAAGAPCACALIDGRNAVVRPLIAQRPCTARAASLSQISSPTAIACAGATRAAFSTCRRRAGVPWIAAPHARYRTGRTCSGPSSRHTVRFALALTIPPWPDRPRQLAPQGGDPGKAPDAAQIVGHAPPQRVVLWDLSRSSSL